jgi:hypothetical protein
VAKSLSLRKTIIRKPGDREVVGKMAKPLPGRNSLADVIEKALSEYQEGTTGLRRSAVHEAQGRERR